MANRKTENKKEIKNEEVLNVEKTIVDDTEQTKANNNDDWKKEFVLRCNNRIKSYLFHIWDMLDYYKQEDDESTEDVINALMSDIFEETEEIDQYCKSIFYGE